MADVSSVTVGFWVGTGSRDEEASQAGASHMLEHLLFKGTGTRTARQIAEAVDAVGGDMNAFTTKEYTAFYVRLLGEHLDLGLDVLCDIMWSPALRADDLESERRVILEEILMHADEPGDLVYERLAGLMFPNHSLGREVLGDGATVGSIGTGALRAFFEHHYGPLNMVVAAAGAVEHEAVAAGLEARFAGRSGGQAPGRRPPEHPPGPLVVTRRPTEQAHLAVGMATPDRHHPDRWALAVLNHVLGGGVSSRLFQEVREQRGLAYSVYSDRVAYHDAGVLTVYVGTAPVHTREVLDLVHSELDRMAESGITEAERRLAVGHLRADMLLSLEDSAARMGRIGRSLLLHGEVLSVETLLDRVAAVSCDDVGRVAELHVGGPRSLAVVGPFEVDDFVSERVA